MKKRTKIISLCLALVLLFGAVGGTLAWLTDKDTAVNVFTVGNIDIEILDEEPIIEAYHFNADGDYVVIEAPISAEASVQTLTSGTKTSFTGLVPGNGFYLNSTVENKGKNDAYVRVAVVFNNVSEMNVAIDEYFEPLYKKQFKHDNPDAPDAVINAMVEDAVQKIYDEMFNLNDSWGMQHKKTDAEPRRMWLAEREQLNYLYSDMAVKIDNGDGTSYYQYSATNEFMTNDEKNDSEHDGDLIPGDQKGYYEKALNPNERIYVFYAKLGAHQEDDGSYYFGDEITLFNGLKVPTCFDNENMGAFDGLEIGVYADAIQVDGFETAEDAFEALQNQHPLGWWNTDTTTTP